MEMILVSILDLKAESYRFPQFYPSLGQAIRAFQTSANDPEIEIGRYPEDFVLCEMGTFDDKTGKMILNEHPKQIGRATSFTSKGKEE